MDGVDSKASKNGKGTKKRQRASPNVATEAARGRKHNNRPEERIPSAAVRRRNVPPPPPPPPALVSLLKSDRDVLSYFQSLKQNLEADVDVWKQRAQTWQSKYEEALEAAPIKERGQRRKKKADETPATPRGSPKARTADRSSKQQPAARSASQKRNASNGHAAASESRRRPPPVGASLAGRGRQDSDGSDVMSVDDDALKDIMEQASSSSPSCASEDNDDDEDRRRSALGGAEEPIDDAMLTKLLMESSSSSSSSDDDEDDARETGKRKVNGASLARRSFITPGDDSDDESESNSVQDVYWEEAVSFLRDELGISSLRQSEPPADGSDAIGDDGASDLDDAMQSDQELAHPSDVGATAQAVPATPRVEIATAAAAAIANRIVTTSSSNRTLDPLEVITEITSAIRMLCRVQQLVHDQDPPMSRSYSPFHTTTLLPIIDGSADGAEGVDTSHLLTLEIKTDRPQHPLIRAKSRLFRSVLILDTFRIEACEALKQEQHPNHHRHSLGGIMHNWLLSLQGEIAEGWACHDRAQQQTNAALVFESAGDSLGLEMNPNDTAPGKVSIDRSPSFSTDNGNATNDDDLNHLKSTDIERFTGVPKMQNRLSVLLERYLMAQLVVGVMLAQGNFDDAYALVIDYVCSNSPTIHDSSRLAPTLSLVVVRGLLHPSSTTNSPCWFLEHVMSQGNDSGSTILIRTLFLVLRRAASLWKARLQSTDDRIVDMSLIELASWQDLLSASGSWLIRDVCLDEEDSPPELEGIVHRIKASSLLEASDGLLTDALRLALIASADEQSLRVSLVGNLQRVDNAGLAIACASAVAYRQLALRQVDSLREVIGRTATSDVRSESRFPLLERELRSQNEPIETLLNILDCASLLSDGQMVYHAVVRLLELTPNCDRFEMKTEMSKNLFHVVNQASETPTVRVINLQRRTDRLDSFRAQSMREDLIVLHAIPDAPFDTVDGMTQSSTSFFGGYAFDGGGRKAEVHERFSRLLGSMSKLPSLVYAQWRPNDLKPFDKDAPNDESLVKMSDSEIACALSHIASWRGALRSFHVCDQTDSKPSYFRHPQFLLRLFRLGGFAKGDALLSKNASMTPAPVCIILEDDAVLVDRFRERLEEVLSELPRDFHLCSLGYGRPKSAPIFPYSEHLGVPSHLFYMTGYLVSEAGCRHLLSSLPVVGPVDTWIGLKMTQNWDNSFGVALGVGSHSRPTTDAAPSRKDLSRILQFRAYCALTPLCSQRVGVSTGGGTEDRSWRQRDTDIVFSGDSLSRGFRRQ